MSLRYVQYAQNKNQLTCNFFILQLLYLQCCYVRHSTEATEQNKTTNSTLIKMNNVFATHVHKRTVPRHSGHSQQIVKINNIILSWQLPDSYMIYILQSRIRKTFIVHTHSSLQLRFNNAIVDILQQVVGLQMQTRHLHVSYLFFSALSQHRQRAEIQEDILLLQPHI